MVDDPIAAKNAFIVKRRMFWICLMQMPLHYKSMLKNISGSRRARMSMTQDFRIAATIYFATSFPVVVILAAATIPQSLSQHPLFSLRTANSF
jgi:hypothetical protein